MVNVQRMKELPIGAKVKMGTFQSHTQDFPMIWRIVSNNHHELDSNYPINAVTVITDDVIYTMSYDAKEPDNDNELRAGAGNNRYRLSNIRQWLNSNLGGSHWFYPQNIEGEYHYNDRDTAPVSESIVSGWRHYPYNDLNGFLSFFRDFERNSILSTKIKVGVNDVYDYNPTVNGVERYDLLEDKIFLPSSTELGFGENDYHRTESKKIAEGAAIPYFEVAGNRKSAMNKAAFMNSKYSRAMSDYTYDSLVYSYMTRSSHLGSPTQFYLGDEELSVAGSPNNVYCVRPMCNLNGETLVTATQDANGFYTIVADVAPVVEIEEIKVLDVRFKVHDMQGYATRVEAFFNGNSIGIFESNLNNTLIATIPYDAISDTQNELIFTTLDNGGLTGNQIFKLDIKVGLVNVGDLVSGKNETFNVINMKDNNDGTLTITTDRNLKYRIEEDRDVELLDFNYKPKVHFTENYHSAPNYVDMQFKSLVYNDNNTVSEEWEFEGDGVYSKTKVDIKRQSIHDSILLKSVSQIYKYKDEM